MTDAMKRIISNLHAGCHLGPACKAAGVAPQTVREWSLRGKNGEEPYATFDRELSLASAAHEQSLINKVAQAVDEDWKAAAWLLSRRFPSRWGDKTKQRIEINQRVSVAVQAELVALAEQIRNALPFDDAQRLIEAINATATEGTDAPRIANNDTPVD